jgi:hypothetical protein
MIATIGYWFGFATLVGFVSCLFIFPILAIFRSTRAVAAFGYIACSYLFGFCLWLECVFTVFDAWGAAAVIIGLFIVGIGVLPMTLVIFALSSQWWLFLEVIVIGIVVFGIRLLGVWLAEETPIRQTAPRLSGG